jgi:excinuclease ABC subunit A
MALNQILVKGARQHNLKNIDVVIPRDKLVVITGLSGSGKSTLAFDTIYAEGQRRYVESLSSYARQFLEQMDKPDVDYIEGLSPAISIEQKTTSKNPRSTVGTVTEIYDFLRVLFARIGEPYCWQCGQKISSQSVQEIVDQLMNLQVGTRIQLLSPLVTGRKGEHQKLLEQLKREGFVRVRINGEVRELEEDILLDKNKKHTIEAVVDRLVIKEGLQRRLTDSAELALKLSQGFLRVLLPGGEETLFSERFSCDRCDISLPELTPQLFSFNNPQGACPTCDGLGTKMYFDPDLIVPNQNLNLREGAVVPWENRSSVYFQQMLEALFSHYHFDFYTPYKDLSPKVKEVLLHGSGKEAIRFYFEKEGRRHFYERPFEGIIPNLDRRYRETDSTMIREELERFMNVRPCPTCKGTRLKKESLAVKIQDLSIHQVTSFSVKEAKVWFNTLQLSARQTQIARRILKEINDRLEFLANVGLDYLTLNRTSATLSGGEGQRIRLATQIGSHLMGVLYVLDEPSIGLHPRDNLRLLQTLKTLRDIGNTVLVVEHDSNTILSSDYVIDMGPGAGEHGGQVVFSGTPEELLKDPSSLTGQYLSGRRIIPIPALRRPQKKGHIQIKGASENNLKQIEDRKSVV